MTKQPLKLVAIAVAALSLVSCVDERYDFDNVDMTIGTTGDLTLPSSSTGDILLSNILDVTEDGVVQVINGEFYLVENGNANVPSIDISPITIARPVLSQLDATVELDTRASHSLQYSAALNSAAAGSIPSVPDATYTFTITPEDHAYYQFPDNIEGDVPADVVDLSEVSFADGTVLEMNLNVDFGPKSDFIKYVYLDNIVVSVPKGLHVAKAELQQELLGTTEVFPAKQIDNARGRIVLTGTDRKVHVNSKLTMRVTVDKAIVGQEGVSFDGDKILLDGKVYVDGSYRIESTDFDHSRFTPEQKAAIISFGSYDVVCPRSLDMMGNSSFVSDIFAKNIRGEVLTTVDDINPITLDDIPDFLNEPDVVLDLVNPVFYIEINNPMPGNLRTSLALISKYHDGTPDVRRESTTFSVPDSTRSVVRIADSFDGLVLPKRFEGMNVVDVRVADLAGLLTKLPDVIDVEIADVRMAANDMPIHQYETKHYQITIDYMVYTPLELGENTNLVYKGVEEGLSEDLEDINKMDTKAIEINAVAETNFPLDLTLSVDAQDIHGVSLVNDIVTVDDVIIGAHKGTEEFSLQNIQLTIKPTEGHTIRQLLQQMDKFVYRAVAHGDGKLMENAYLKLTKIKVTLKGGVSYDAN